MTESLKTSQPASRDESLNHLTAWRILEAMGESVAVMNTDYEILWFKEPLSTMILADVKVIGETCYKAFYGKQEPCRGNCPVRPVIEEGRAHVVERYFIDHQGRERWREARAFPIVDGWGQTVLVARISHDITRRKQRQARDLRQREDLERALGEMNRLSLEDLPFHPTGPAPELTKREVEVLRLLAQGLSKPRIAGVLSISPNTVKRHVDNIFNKLGVNDRTQAAIWAARAGMV